MCDVLESETGYKPSETMKLELADALHQLLQVERQLIESWYRGESITTLGRLDLSWDDLRGWS